MNISQPVASYIGSVDFEFLSSEDIKHLSVKRIQNPTTFDSLLHPVPGGLYDAALGAWADNACATCHLNTYACPGHVGHIELPVPVYHVTFMDQLLQLLRVKCGYCGHLKLHSAEVNRFICKLRLIHHGLLGDAQDLENIHLRSKTSSTIGMSGPAIESNVESEESEEEDADSLIKRRNTFVKLAIKNAGRTQHRIHITSKKTEAVAEARRAVIKEFLAAGLGTRACGRCKGISIGYRIDQSRKIFRKPLSRKNRAQMAQGGLELVNPLVRSLEMRKAIQKQKREDRKIDEGIVADFEDITTDESGEDIDMLEIGAETLSQDLSDSQHENLSKKSRSEEEISDIYVNPQEVHASVSELFEKEREIFDLVYNHRTEKYAAPVTADIFFIKFVLVPPNKFRPDTRTRDDEIAEAPQNTYYKQILGRCEILNQIRKEISGSPTEAGGRHRDFTDLQTAWVQLQDDVNSLIDSSKNQTRNFGGRENEDGIKQILEKKDGLFRKNMMGKRVNFAARSVISPDPNIETNEIGVPLVFAKKLTYPEPVTNHNFYELKEAVLNGTEKWPGAAAIENENGQVINLRTKNFEERQALANQLLAPSSISVTGARSKKVHRHLNNGDVVLMNRQPTLHKPSIMAHRARILPGEKTIRMHYANCHTYNADFDGDEMNMHFPQNEIARAEALQIADTDHQFLVATSGKPLRGLIQDHISMGVWLTNRDTFFDREEYHQLLYGCLRPEDNHTATDRIQTVAPAMMKPVCIWTGKQVISSILRNITPETHPGLTLLGKSQTAGSQWADKSEEDLVVIRSGDLLCGILDKAHLGPSGGGFLHAVYEAYGHTVAGRLLSVLGRLLTKLLHMRAFSCGMDDLLLTREGDRERRKKLEQAESIGLEVAAKYVTVDVDQNNAKKDLFSRVRDVIRDEEKHMGLDNVYNSRTSTLSSEITSACLPIGLRKTFPWNQMQMMTVSGAKGTSVNANFISCNLGQQVLEGRRVPVMVSGKTLPSFKAFETNVRAGGYITDRFLTGIRPQEYYFHAMAGREGLIDTAVKTSRSGYLQRCLIKGMEGLRVEYDSSVRDSDGSMVQFLYGEDGLDVTKQKHLTDFKFLVDNYLSLVAQLNIREEHSHFTNNRPSEHHKAAMKMVKKGGKNHVIDPVLAIFNPGSNLGSTSENFGNALKAYCETNPENLLRDKKKSPNAPVSKKTFRALLDMKYLKSVIDPGEAVGIVAGQSVGEPSTQMTLNTFHLAGHSARNVTLGIPRLREIVMTAGRNIATPTMTLHPIPELSEETHQRFAKGITKRTLAEVIDKVSVSESIQQGISYEQARTYDIKLQLFPSAKYQEIYAIQIPDILRTIEYRFIPQLLKAIKKEYKRQGSSLSPAQPKIGISSRVIKDAPLRAQENGKDGDDDENDDEDEDATNTKQRANQKEAISYAAPDEGEEAIAKEVQTDDEDKDGESSVIHNENDEEIHDSAIDNSISDGDKGVPDISAKGRELRIKETNPEVTKFSFDYEQGVWCKVQLKYEISEPKILMISLVEEVCHSAIIQAIPGILACTYTHEKIRSPTTGRTVSNPVVLTQGVNLRAMLDQQNVIDPHRIFTNDIHAVLLLYGVEACRATIIREMDAVFKGHSITVDNRHLNLIADVMTKGGGYTPFNRTGLKSGTSPFMKMSFETTVAFLKDAVLEGDRDDLKGPSARIVMGKLGRMGTGAFDILTSVE